MTDATESLASSTADQTESTGLSTKSPKTGKRRQFKGQSMEERQKERREKLIEAGLQVYGTVGFFSVTVRDVCSEAKLTERYFYESFKRSEELFKAVYLRLIDQLQKNILQAVMQSGQTNFKLMVNAGLNAMFTSLQNDPRMARILFIDAMLVHEMFGEAIADTLASFDRMAQAMFTLMFPKETRSQLQLSLISTGLNGYVIHIATRWVMGGFKEPLEDVIAACGLVYQSIIQHMISSATNDPALTQ